MSKRKSGITVMKFGGTSVMDTASITNVIRIVKKTPGKKVVVVSAISRATNALEQMARYASENRVKEAELLLDDIISRHHVIIGDLVTDRKLAIEATGRIMNYHSNIAELIHGLAIIGELSLRTLDSFRVFGELMSSTVISFAMKSHGINAGLIDSRHIIKTDNEFSRAYPDFKLTGRNVDKVIKPMLRKGKVVLAQGFIASTEDGISTTMGRESSDFSAAIYGALLDADEIQIWTDVDGVLTADPNMIKSARKLKEISFNEMEELSNFGAKVLHKNSVKPAFKKNIPLRILNSKNMRSTGTEVHSGLSHPELVKSITYKKNIRVLCIKPKETLNQYIFWEMMLNILSRHKPQIDILVSSNNALIIVIAENNYTKIHWEEMQSEFEQISEYELMKEKALITLVGSDLSSIDSFEKRLFGCCKDMKSDSVVSGFNKHSFALLVNSDSCEKVMKALHKEFFEQQKLKTDLFEKIKSARK